MTADSGESWPAETFLGRIGDAHAQALIAKGTRREAPAGSVLLCEGDTGDDLLLILEGLVRVTASNGEQTKLLAVRGPGDLLGETTAFGGGCRSATVTACEPLRYATISRARFREYAEGHPVVGTEVTAQVTRRLRWANDRRLDAGLPLPVRLARLMLDVATCTRPGADPVVPYTQADLASMVGATEDAVQRALRVLRDDHVISTEYGAQRILDLTALKRRAELP